ncbi:hypothetical protein [Demequina litorisediminis]|uniref:Uncharacterized protein n=1 Tax=Demequina litorisediminis TaxID=1849022 RepID=A0ABQ6IBI0_9MICO|nr:hypothetical protein [Demequina litorisediminis]GMA35140.1 hypothetical protein GCM10025876_13440 [Demequina litorisediminis]
MTRSWSVSSPRRSARNRAASPSLIQEIIEISRLQGGESVVDHHVIDLGAVVEEVCEGAEMHAESKQVTLVAEPARASVGHG